MLIEEIASTTTTTHDDDDDDDKDDNSSSFSSPNEAVVAAMQVVVNECIDSLMQHYRQPIHHECNDDANDTDNYDYEPTPIVQQYLNKITLQQRQELKEDRLQPRPKRHPANVGNMLCHAYATKIRPELFESPSIHRLERRIQKNGIAVLVHYQSLVSNYYYYRQQQQQHDIPNDNDKNNDPSSFVHQNDDDERIDDLIIMISCDITAVQAMYEEIENETTEETPSTDSSTVITTRMDGNQLELVTRCLVRLLNQLLQQKTSIHHPSSSSSGIRASSDHDSSRKQRQQNALRRCACTLMALECSREPVSDSSILTDKLDPSGTIPDALLNTSQYLSFSQTGIPSSPQITLPPLPEQILEWVGLMKRNSSCPKIANAKPSSSIRSTTTQLALQATWEHLANVCGISHPTTTTNRDPNHIQYHVLECLGQEFMSQAIRAHFFARDILPEDTVVVILPSQRLHLGHTITETKSKRKDPMAKKSYQINPSRCKATLFFLFHIKTLNSEILDQVLPILYELLNASSDIHVGCGAACLFHLLNCTSISSSALLWSHGPVADNLLSMLEKNIQICRKGTTLVLLGLAQRRLFQVLFTINDKYRQQRRQSTHRWLRILDRHSRHFTKDYLVWGLLMGGIVPLLYDHAVSNENADALELGRLGLQALLPTIRGECGYDNLDGKSLLHAATTIYDGKDSKDLHLHSGDRGVLLSVAVLIPALVALSNLLMSAHPIMPRHSGKIICELVAFLRKHEWPELEDEKLLNKKVELLMATKRLAIHVAAMAMVVCGEPASAVMNQILGMYKNEIDTKTEAQVSNYDDHVVKIALLIKAEEANLRTYMERNK